MFAADCAGALINPIAREIVCDGGEPGSELLQAATPKRAQSFVVVFFEVYEEIDCHIVNVPEIETASGQHAPNSSGGCSSKDHLPKLVPSLSLIRQASLHQIEDRGTLQEAKI
jgi:hypothetical protein